MLRELEELCADPQRRRERAVSSLGKLVGASVVVMIRFENFVDSRSRQITHCQDNGRLADHERAVAAMPYYSKGIVDPLLERLAEEAHAPLVARCRSEVMSESEWLTSPLFNDHRRPIGLGDALYSARKSRDAGAHDVILLLRVLNDRSFSIADRLLVELFHQSFDPEWTAPRTPRLSRRERMTLERLLRGQAEKQIAGELGLSYHTIHMHVRSIYRKFGVTTRAELMALGLQREANRGIE
jgi:DNA-binding CsgD family transcriptional regulator